MLRRFIHQYKKRKNESLLHFKHTLLGLQPMIAVDVGSAGGLQPHWRSYEGIVDFYLFEPHKESCEQLKDLLSDSAYPDKFHVLPTGLSEKGGQRTLYMLNCPTGSSLLPVNPESDFADPDNSYIYPIKEASIETSSLADALTSENVNQVDMIKLDVQGAEMEILQGMGALRENLLLAEIEVNINHGVLNNIGPYVGGPTWAEVDDFLTKGGMRLLDVSVARSYRSKAGDSDWYQRNVFNVYENTPTLSANVWEADVVYVRDWKLLIEQNDAKGVRRLIVALCGYRFFSEAYFIIEQAEAGNIFSQYDADELKKNVVGWHEGGRYFWHGRNIIMRFLRKVMRVTGISQLLRWKQYMWFDYPNG